MVHDTFHKLLPEGVKKNDTDVSPMGKNYKLLHSTKLFSMTKNTHVKCLGLEIHNRIST